MKKNISKGKILILLLSSILFIFPINNIFTETAYAYGWVNTDSGDIYKGQSDATDTEPDTSDPIWIEKQIIKLLKGPCDMFLKLETAFGVNLDQIIYGRVSPSGKSINYFSFELAKGNIWGNIGAFMYNIYRTICVFIIWLAFVTMVIKTMLITSSAKIRDEFKQDIMKVIVFTLLLYLMPYIFQIVEYLRDCVLSLIYDISGDIVIDGITGSKADAIKSAMENNGGGVGGGITAVFSVMAEQSWVCALLYGGAMMLSLYFVYQYLSVAMGMLLSFIFFALVVVFSFKDSKILDMWVKNVFSSLMVPVLDAMLLLIPVAFFNALKTKGIIMCAIITLMICTLIIPCRKVIGGLLGLNTNGLANLGASAMNAFALMKGAQMIGHGVSNALQHRKNAKEANEKADMYDELAQLEKNGDDIYSGNIGKAMRGVTNGIPKSNMVEADKDGQEPNNSGIHRFNHELENYEEDNEPLNESGIDTNNSVINMPDYENDGIQNTDNISRYNHVDNTGKDMPNITNGSVISNMPDYENDGIQNTDNIPRYNHVDNTGTRLDFNNDDDTETIMPEYNNDGNGNIPNTDNVNDADDMTNVRNSYNDYEAKNKLSSGSKTIGNSSNVNLNALPGYINKDYKTAAASAKAISSDASSKSSSFKAKAYNLKNEAKSDKNRAYALGNEIRTNEKKMEQMRLQHGIGKNNIHENAIYAIGPDGQPDTSGPIIGYSTFTPEENVIYSTYAQANQSAQQDMDMYNNRAQLKENEAVSYDTKATYYSQKAANYTAAAGQINMEQVQMDNERQQKERAIREKYANINNISSPEFSDISYAKKAELMRAYAKREKRKAITTGVGTVYGAAVGAGSGVFFGSKGMVLGAAFGTNMGYAVGNVTENVSDRIVDFSQSQYKNIEKNKFNNVGGSGENVHEMYNVYEQNMMNNAGDGRVQNYEIDNVQHHYRNLSPKN